MDPAGNGAEDGEGATVVARDLVVRTGSVVKEKLTVLDLLEEMKQGWEEKNRDVFAQAILNERFISGRQQYDLSPSSQTVQKVDRGELPNVVRNQLRNLSLTWAARVNDSTSDTRAWADKPGVAQLVAVVAHLHLQHQKEKQNRQRMLARAAMRGLAGGSVYFKTTMDPMRGEIVAPHPILDPDGVPIVDETGNVVMDGEPRPSGDNSVDLQTIFDVITDGAEDIENARWACCRRVMDEYEARALLEEAGHKDAEPESVTDRKNMWDDEIEGVEAYEMWMLPCARVPDGMFALVVGGYVVDYRDFPYDHGELPFACWKIFDRSDSQYGDTQVTETIEQQRALNELTCALVQMAFKHGANVIGLAAQSILDEIETGEKLIPVTVEDATKALHYATSPEPPEMLLTVIRMLLESIPEAFGVNEVVASGGAPQQTKSARQLAYIKALDGQKLWLPLQNLVAALVRVDWQQTMLAQQFMTPDRMIEIVGEENALGVEAFFECDLRTTIRIEAAPASENTRAAAAANAEEGAVAGFVDPARAGELRETGLDTTADESAMRRKLQEQIAGALHGEAVEPDLMVDAKVAVGELTMAAEVWGARNPQAAQALQQLLVAYQDLAAQAGAEQQQPMGRPTAAPQAEAQQPPQGAMP